MRPPPSRPRLDLLPTRAPTTDPTSLVLPCSGLALEGGSVDPLKAHDNPLLQQKMKPRHLQMIAVGGSIGTGLFIGSGQALRNGGPAGILIAWAIIGVMLINVTQALGEMCILYPVSGGFYTLAVRFIDPGMGMALGASLPASSFARSRRSRTDAVRRARRLELLRAVGRRPPP